jgi:LysR family transcriptional regulator, hydrogen peroxide-inducible genes activator
MEIHQLRYFLAVASTCNFSRAAEQCRVAQPSLSQQIMKLEDELGERLFERTKREVSLTPAGERLRAHAERVLDELEQARASVCEEGGVVRGRVELGVLPTVAPFYLPERLRDFAAKYPDVEVVIHEDTTAQLARAVVAKEIDLALVSLPVAQRGLSSVTLFEEPLLAALPSDHPLAKKRKITLADLEHEPFILMQEGHCLSGQALAFCRMEGFAPKVSFRSAQIETMRAFVAAGWGVSVVPQMAVQGTAGDGGAVRYRALGGMSREIGFIFNEQRTPSRAKTALLEFFKARSRSAPAKK